MTANIKLLVLVGSTGSRSLSGKLAQLCQERIRAKCPAVDVAILDPEFMLMPILDVDKYRTGELFLADQVQRLQAQCMEADAFIMISPVQHGSYSGALKNVLDHLPSNVLRGKPVFVAVQAAGLRGSQSARDHLHSVIRALGGWSTPTSLVVENNDHQGRLPAQVLSRIDDGISELVTFCERFSPIVPRL